MSISEYRSKKTKRARNKEESHQAVIFQPTEKRMEIFWSSKADLFLLPFLDRSDMMKLSMSKLLRISLKYSKSQP